MKNRAQRESLCDLDVPAVQSQVAGFGRLEDPAWDQFVEAHPQGWLCHLSAWQRVLNESFPHIQGHLVVIRGGASIRAGLPVYCVRSWLSGNRLVSIPFATLCHPLATHPEDTARLLDAVLEFSRTTGSRYVEIRAMRPLMDGVVDRFARSDGFKHHCLAVEAGPEALRKRFDRSCVRQRIDRALKSGVDVATVSDDRGLRQFYALYLKLRSRLGLPPHPYRFIRALWDTFSPSGRVQVQLAMHGGVPLAGILLFRFNGRVSAEYLVSDDSRRDLSPNHLLVWNAIRKAHEDGFRVFDFGRTHVANASLVDFKGRWGTTVSDLPVYYHPPSHGRSPEAGDSRLKLASRAAFRRMPEWCSRWLGERIYSHMG
jgi:serine/alanine adding enzyme